MFDSHNIGFVLCSMRGWGRKQCIAIWVARLLGWHPLFAGNSIMVRTRCLLYTNPCFCMYCIYRCNFGYSRIRAEELFLFAVHIYYCCIDNSFSYLFLKLCYIYIIFLFCWFAAAAVSSALACYCCCFIWWRVTCITVASLQRCYTCNVVEYVTVFYTKKSIFDPCTPISTKLISDFYRSNRSSMVLATQWPTVLFSTGIF